MRFACIAFVLTLAAAHGAACDAPASVCPHDGKGSFALIRAGRPAAILIAPDADPAIRHAVDAFAGDLQRVSGQAPARLEHVENADGAVVIIGEIGKSPAIDALLREGKIAAADIKGKWEGYRQIVIDKPFAGIARALVILGADRRGAVFGTYDISEKIGVSPWHWFADVPVRRRTDIFITAGARADWPRVKYRGFFINDEAPAFSTWANKTFGGANAKLYAHVFELILRMKGNYLWPAMWAPRAFAADDPDNMVLADAMGVVMGSSHHEPMARAHDEWHRDTETGITGGKWDYRANAENLRAFWRGGIERMMSKGGGAGYENVVTIGMRGDGDEPMAEGTAIHLLEAIVADQRKIIAEVTGKPPEQTPQVWALYKEVQDYFERGMKVPDDVILLFCDDNWGQIRRLPTEAMRGRGGGAGIYYHFDYVGAPRNYKWINTNQIEKIWQQMNLAYESGARALWVVNVGDIKPMEYPLDFFLKMAWNPEAMTPEALAAYSEDWARANFGPRHTAAIARALREYGTLAARRKPELIDEDSFPPDEFAAMTARWQRLEDRITRIEAGLDASYRDAFFQLVAHPIEAMTNLYRLYHAVARNRALAAVNDPAANRFADIAEAAFARDAQLTQQYHRMRGGKWDGMMLQTHIGYSGWQQPDRNIMPEVVRVAETAAVPIAARSERPSGDGEVLAVDAWHYSRAYAAEGLQWRSIPNLGRTYGAMLALPQGRPAGTPADGVRLEYDFALKAPGDADVHLIMAPSIDTKGGGGIRVGISLDNGPVRIAAMNLIPTPGEAVSPAQKAWVKAVKDNAHTLSVRFAGLKAGRHVLKYWRIDDNAVLQKLVIATGAVPPSYLGPEETYDAARRLARQ